MFSTVWNTQKFTELGREEKGEGGYRGDLVEKKERMFGQGRRGLAQVQDFHRPSITSSHYLSVRNGETESLKVKAFFASAHKTQFNSFPTGCRVRESYF